PAAAHCLPVHPAFAARSDGQEDHLSGARRQDAEPEQRQADQPARRGSRTAGRLPRTVRRGAGARGGPSADPGRVFAAVVPDPGALCVLEGGERGHRGERGGTRDDAAGRAHGAAYPGGTAARGRDALPDCDRDNSSEPTAFSAPTRHSLEEAAVVVPDAWAGATRWYASPVGFSRLGCLQPML